MVAVFYDLINSFSVYLYLLGKVPKSVSYDCRCVSICNSGNDTGSTLPNQCSKH